MEKIHKVKFKSGAMMEFKTIEYIKDINEETIGIQCYKGEQSVMWDLYAPIMSIDYILYE